MKKQTFSLWDSYKEECEAEGIKPNKRAFRKTEADLKRTCTELRENRRVLILHKPIDDVFSYVVVIEEAIVHPSIMRNEDVKARISCIKRDTA